MHEHGRPATPKRKYEDIEAITPPATPIPQKNTVIEALIRREKEERTPETKLPKLLDLIYRMRRVSNLLQVHMETYYVAVHFLDTYIYKSEVMHRHATLVLYANVCVYLAAKVYEDVLEPTLGQITAITGMAEKQVHAIERRILAVLGWATNPVTPWALIDQLGSARTLPNINTDALDHVKDFTRYPPSVWAACAALFSFSRSEHRQHMPNVLSDLGLQSEAPVLQCREYVLDSIAKILPQDQLISIASS